jgi:hypothetical protein
MTDKTPQIKVKQQLEQSVQSQKRDHYEAEDSSEDKNNAENPIQKLADKHNGDK